MVPQDQALCDGIEEKLPSRKWKPQRRPQLCRSCWPAIKYLINGLMNHNIKVLPPLSGYMRAAFIDLACMC